MDLTLTLLIISSLNLSLVILFIIYEKIIKPNKWKGILEKLEEEREGVNNIKGLITHIKKDFDEIKYRFLEYSLEKSWQTVNIKFKDNLEKISQFELKIIKNKNYFIIKAASDILSSILIIEKKKMNWIQSELNNFVREYSRTIKEKIEAPKKDWTSTEYILSHEFNYLINKFFDFPLLFYFEEGFILSGIEINDLRFYFDIKNNYGDCKITHHLTIQNKERPEGVFYFPLSLGSTNFATWGTDIKVKMYEKEVSGRKDLKNKYEGRKFTRDNAYFHYWIVYFNEIRKGENIILLGDYNWNNFLNIEFDLLTISYGIPIHNYEIRISFPFDLKEKNYLIYLQFFNEEGNLKQSYKLSSKDYHYSKQFDKNIILFKGQDLKPNWEIRIDWSRQFR